MKDFDGKEIVEKPKFPRYKSYSEFPDCPVCDGMLDEAFADENEPYDDEDVECLDCGATFKMSKEVEISWSISDIHEKEEEEGEEFTGLSPEELEKAGQSILFATEV